MKKFTYFLLLLGLLGCSSSNKKSDRYLALADETKKARKNDVADSYTLSNGVLRRQIGNNTCDITTNVDGFRISMHPKDAAMIYFEKDGDLYVLHNAETSGNCPATSKNKIVSGVKKYTVVSNTNTNVVNLTLSRSGDIKAWDNKRPIWKASNIKRYVNNTCYGSKKNLSFSTYVAFAIDYKGYVHKIKGQNTASSKSTESDNKQFNSLKDFKDFYNVCESTSQKKSCKVGFVKKNYQGWRIHSDCRCAYYQQGKFHHYAKKGQEGKCSK